MPPIVVMTLTTRLSLFSALSCMQNSLEKENLLLLTPQRPPFITRTLGESSFIAFNSAPQKRHPYLLMSKAVYACPDPEGGHNLALKERKSSAAPKDCTLAYTRSTFQKKVALVGTLLADHRILFSSSIFALLQMTSNVHDLLLLFVFQLSIISAKRECPFLLPTTTTKDDRKKGTPRRGNILPNTNFKTFCMQCRKFL